MIIIDPKHEMNYKHIHGRIPYLILMVIFKFQNVNLFQQLLQKKVNIHILFTDSVINLYMRNTRFKLRTVAELLDLLDCVDLNENNMIDFNEFVCKFSKNQTIAIFDKSCALPTTFVRITWEELGTLIGVTGLQWVCVLGLILDRYAVLHDIHNPNAGWIGTFISYLGFFLFTFENLLCNYNDTNIWVW